MSVKHHTPNLGQVWMAGATLLTVGDGFATLYYKDGTSKKVPASVIIDLDAKTQWLTIVDRIQTHARQ